MIINNKLLFISVCLLIFISFVESNQDSSSPSFTDEQNEEHKKACI